MKAYVLVAQMLEQLQFTVRSFGQHRGAERLHDLLDRHGLPGKLVLGGAVALIAVRYARRRYSEQIRKPTRRDRRHPFRRAEDQCNCWVAT